MRVSEVVYIGYHYSVQRTSYYFSLGIVLFKKIDDLANDL
jgi:hypothetical protein